MMTWIKSHPAQTAVLALSLSLAGSSLKIYREYSSVPRSPIPDYDQLAEPKIPDLDHTRLEAALVSAREPGLWQAPKGGRLFASKPYVPIQGELQRLAGKMFRPPVPNDWLLKYGLDPLAPDVLESDPDKDGFTTLQEWLGEEGASHLARGAKTAAGPEAAPLPDDSTSPVSSTAHPSYHTRLFLEQVEQKPFRLRFLSHDSNPKQPRQVTVQINAVPGRTEFVEVGAPLRFAPFDVRSFTRKEAPGREGTTRDISEVVLKDRRTGQDVTLPIGEVVNSPENFAVLRFEWSPAGTNASSGTFPRFRARVGETFRLPPGMEVYRVASISPEVVEIITPSGETYPVKKAPAQRPIIPQQNR